MADPRVAVYLDFDNIVMSSYDRVHGRNSYSRDRAKIADDATDAEIVERLQLATIDVGAIIDYAASFGTLVLTRAYADWSSPVNADYRRRLVARAVDLVQLFPAAAYAKNGADIRLAVDAVEDMFRLPDLTHVVIVGGDSDYVPLAQRVRRLGRPRRRRRHRQLPCEVAGSHVRRVRRIRHAAGGDRSRGEAGPHAPRRRAKDQPADAAVEETKPKRPGAASCRRSLSRIRSNRRPNCSSAPSNWAACRDNNDDAEWLHPSAVKQHMRRMDPSFGEKSLGFRSFNAFLRARDDIAELSELRPRAAGASERVAAGLPWPYRGPASRSSWEP